MPFGAHRGQTGTSRKTTDQLNLPLLFRYLPGMYVVMSADPKFHVVAISRGWMQATMTPLEAMVGQPLFDAFPGNPDEDCPGIVALRASLQRILQTSQDESLPVALYQMMLPEGLVNRYWKPTNTAVLNTCGRLAFILHHVEDLSQEYQAESRCSPAMSNTGR